MGIRGGRGVAKVVIGFIDRCDKTLDAAVYAITHDGISDALIRAKRRGVDVRIITDKTQASGKYSDDEKLIEAKIPVIVSGHHWRGSMHNKFVIGDGEAIGTGSFNWTKNADKKNSENFVIIRIRYAVKEYQREFDSLWEMGKKFKHSHIRLLSCISIGDIEGLRDVHNMSNQAFANPREFIDLSRFQNLKGMKYAHIPKTGGTSIRKSLGHTSIGHQWAPRNDSFFSVVRNPFDWLISMWHWNGSRPTTRWNGWWHVRDVWPNLESFLYNFNSHEPIGSPRWDEGGPFPPPQWPGDEPPTYRPFFSYRHLQTCQTFDLLDTPGKKNSYAKLYIRMEMIPSAMSVLGINKKIHHYNKSKHADYRSYYDTKLIDHIAQHRQQELSLLGYDFEGPVDDLSVFKIAKPFIWDPVI